MTTSLIRVDSIALESGHVSARRSDAGINQASSKNRQLPARAWRVLR